MTITADLLVAPQTTPLSGGVLDVATIVEDIGLQFPATALFESYNCVTTDRRATWPCPVEFLAPPVQAAAATAAVGGTVPADTYFITVTAINDEGETLESNERSIITAGATSTVTVNWADVTGATGYRIYVTGGATGTEKFLVEVGDVNLYIWNGAPAIGVADPPTENTAVDVLHKTFENPEWPEGARFVVYAGTECKRFGESDDSLNELERVFLARESYGVERGLVETVLQGATDITPSGGAVSAKVGLAMLEGNAATLYAGLPTIHMPRTIASLLAGDKIIEAQGGKLYTQLGAKVASGGGYDASNIDPSGDPADEGTMWLYASGEVLVLRSAVLPRSAFDTVNNGNLDLVERVYIVAVDCYTAAINVSVE